MTTAFDTAFARTLGHEGGFVDHAADPGGATRYGITQATARAHGYTGSMRELPLTVARDIYRASYWQPARCGDMPAEVGVQVFDAAVNHGVRGASRMLQRAVGVVADGVIGPQTLAAVKAHHPAVIIARLAAERLELMTSLAHWPHFGRGWARRIAGQLKEAHS